MNTQQAEQCANEIVQSILARQAEQRAAVEDQIPPVTPDWDLLEATQTSLREQTAALKAAQESEQRFREQVAAALKELRARIAAERSALFAPVLDEIDATIAKLGLGGIPNCPDCGNNRQVWVNQITGKMTCHRAGCHKEI